MATIVSAIPVVAEQTGREVILVGGLAVICRLPAPHRATSDLDAVDRRATTQRSQLELLTSAGGTPSGPAGVRVQTPNGEVQVDLLDVTDADLEALPDDASGRLYVQSHAWAASTASVLTLHAEGLEALEVKVAEPGPLIAMKLQSIQDRSAAKEGTDLLDILRLSLDQDCGPKSLDQLELADPQLRVDALLHVRLWFETYATQSLSKVQALPEGQDLELDDVHLARELLTSALDYT